MLFTTLSSLFAINRKHLFLVAIAAAVWFVYTAVRYRRVPAAGPVSWTAFDSALMRLIALFGAITAVFLFLGPPLRYPAEDPAILFQFSRNLAHTGAITYIPHGPHAEGATDFAWMVLIALGMKLHVSPLWSVGVINLVSLLGLAVLLTRIANQRLTLSAGLVIIGAYGLMPQAAASILASPCFPLPACWCWLFCVSCVNTMSAFA